MVSLSATPSYGGPPLVVTFDASVFTGIPTSYNWSFGDGTFYNGTNTSAASPTHVYPNPGSYTASVEVFEGLNSGGASIAIHVVAKALAAQITASAVGGQAPLSIWFNATVSGGTGTYVNFSWVFGDGGSGSGPSLRYTFARAGNFHVTLTVHDSGNASASAGVWVNVTSSTATTSVDWSTVAQLAPWFGGGLVAGTLGFWLVRRSTWARPREAVKASHPTVLAPPSTVPESSPPGPGVPTEAEPGPPRSASMSAERGIARTETLLVSQRIILHLVKQGRLGEDEVAPSSLTQGGIAEALAIPQNSLTNVLGRLVAAGALKVDVRHVRGKNRRLKVYRLTDRGEAVARELRSRQERRS